MQSRPYQIFSGRTQYFWDDIEFIDVIKKNINAGNMNSNGSTIFNLIDPNVHTHLNRRINSDGSRKLVVNHLRKTVYTSYVKDLYEEFTMYLRSILTCSVKSGSNINLVVGEFNIDIKLNELISLGSWDKVCDHVVEIVFQKIESQKSTLKLVKQIARRLRIDIDNNIIESAMPFLEARHLFVHEDGKASDEYRKKYKNIDGISFNDEYIVVNYRFIKSLHDSIHELARHIDLKIVNTNLLHQEFIQGKG